jgi:carbonic anhydrase/acetyltransferase-like protein (isoleucine patch superfamily)
MVHTTTGSRRWCIGDEVTVGHRVILHGCTVHDRVLVGMGAIVLDLAVIESDVVIGAGSLVTPGMRLTAGHVYVGAPAKRVRALRDSDRAMIDAGWRAYVDLSKRHG